MATHAIPPGTVNFTLNLYTEERRLLGEISSRSVQAGQSSGVGDYIRELIALALEHKNPEAARRWREIRNSFISLPMLGLAAWVGWQAMQPRADDEDAMRRSRTVCRVRISPRGQRQEVQLVEL